MQRKEREREQKEEKTDSGFVVHGEDTVNVTLDDTRLSGSNITNDKDLVESLVHSFTGLGVSL